MSNFSKAFSPVATIANMTAEQGKYHNLLVEQVSKVAKDHSSYAKVQALASRFVADIAKNDTINGEALSHLYEATRRQIEDELLSPKPAFNAARAAQERCLEDAFRRFGAGEVARMELENFMRDTNLQVHKGELLLDGTQFSDGTTMDSLVQQVAARYNKMRDLVAAAA